MTTGVEESVPGWGLFPSDDQFHEPPTDDPWWLETAWFGWMLPEKKMLGSWYVGMRKNQGIQFGGVTLLGERGELPWELEFSSDVPHWPLPSHVDLDDMDFENGMHLSTVEHGRVFDFSYEHPDLSFDLRYEAAIQPLLTRGAPPFVDAAHIDQIGRVTGEVTIRGRRDQIDCYAMRDRMWGLRRGSRNPRKQLPVGYAYATHSPDRGVLGHLHLEGWRGPGDTRVPCP